MASCVYQYIGWHHGIVAQWRCVSAGQRKAIVIKEKLLYMSVINVTLIVA